MQLYISPGSPYARIVRIVVIEKKLSDKVEVIAAKTRTTDSPGPRHPRPARRPGAGLGSGQSPVSPRQTPRRRWAVERFVKDDGSYLGWLAAHPDGFVLNTWAHVS